MWGNKRLKFSHNDFYKLAIQQKRYLRADIHLSG